MLANLLSLPPSTDGGEIFEDLLSRPGVRIERIISRGHTTPPDQPYVQDWDEWVLVVSGRARLRMGDSEYALEPGGFMLIPAGAAHWVTYTADPTIWLAIHLDQAAA